jgi:N-carbamoylputrescine amidase
MNVNYNLQSAILGMERSLMTLRVTVCELSNDPDELERDWAGLVAHVKSVSSDLVVLPEMAFAPWFAAARQFDPGVWQAAVAAHDTWIERLAELAPAAVGSRPVNVGDRRLNQGFVWDREAGYRPVHDKYYLPDEAGFWEASWYSRGDGDFSPFHSDAVLAGLLICTELWFLDRARAYGQAGAHLIAVPRATERQTREKWVVGGRAAAVVSGAFVACSNRVSRMDEATDLGGQGWIIGPDGDVLGLTSRERPFLSVEVDLREAEQAKQTYPRYVPD